MIACEKYNIKSCLINQIIVNGSLEALFNHFCASSEMKFIIIDLNLKWNVEQWEKASFLVVYDAS